MLTLAASNTLTNPLFSYSTNTLVVQSDLVGYPDLKYKFKIYARHSGSSTEELVYTVEHYPTPNGLGILRPQEIIRNYIKHFPYPYITDGLIDVYSAMQFSIEVSELSPIAESAGIPLSTDVKFIDEFKCIDAIMDYKRSYNNELYLLKLATTPLKRFTTPLYYNSFNESNYASLSIPVDVDLSAGTYKLRVYVYTSLDAVPTITDIDLDDIGAADSFKYHIPAGPKNLLTIDPTIFDGGWSAYILVLIKDANTVLTEPYYVYKKESKQECWDPISFAYLNEFGDFDYITFTGKKRDKQNIKDSTWSEYLPNLYTLGDRGAHSIQSNVNKSFIMNTGILNEYENEHLIKMISSPSVYELTGSGNGLSLLPVTIKTKSLTELTNRNRDRIFNYNIEFEYSFENPKQNG